MGNSMTISCPDCKLNTMPSFPYTTCANCKKTFSNPSELFSYKAIVPYDRADALFSFLFGF